SQRACIARSVRGGRQGGAGAPSLTKWPDPGGRIALVRTRSGGRTTTVDRRTHSFSNGRPKDHVFQTVSTERLPPAERYAFWAEDVIRTFAIPPPDGRQQRDFVASVTSLANPSGEMHHAVGDAYEAHLSARAAASAAFDELSLFLMLEGRALYAYGDGP